MKLSNRILGKWRSNKKKTLEFSGIYHNPKNSKHKKLISSIFGSLEYKITKKYFHAKQKKDSWKCKYKFIFQDSETLIIQTEDYTFGDCIMMITFEETKKKEYICVKFSLCNQVEYFERIK